MRYFAKNAVGDDLFFVEFFRTPDGWYSVESSLPDIIFQFEDVKAHLRNVLNNDSSSIEYDTSVKVLLFSMIERETFSVYYFQPVELKHNGRYNSEQSNVMSDIIPNQDINFFQPVTMQSNPFLFRYVYSHIDLFKNESINDCSIEEYSRYIPDENKITNHANERCSVKYLKLNEDDGIYLKVINDMPVEFYFYRQSEWDKLSF